MPKSQCSAPKVAAALKWIRESGVAHTIKDLEKSLPGPSGINKVQVKEYVESLADENLVRVEKIGSGNWYWSFMSDEKIKKENALAQADAEKLKAESVIEELSGRIEEAEAERQEDEDELMLDDGMDRAGMSSLHAQLTSELNVLKSELAGYSENDPVEVERRRMQILESKRRIDAISDAICSMESWLKQMMGGDRAQLLGMKQQWYGDEFDEDVGGLREV